MTQFRNENLTRLPQPTRRIAEVFVTSGIPGTSWSLNRVFAVFTDGTQDLVQTVDPEEVSDTRALLGLTRAQVTELFGAVRLPN